MRRENTGINLSLFVVLPVIAFILSKPAFFVNHKK